GWQRAIAVAVAAAEGLPGEVVFRQRKTAGELFEPRAQHRRHVAAAGQRLILLRRDAETEQRGLLPRRPADEALVEQRRDGAVEEAPLVLQRACLQRAARVGAVEAGDAVAPADEVSKQAVAIEPAAEDGDALAARKGAAIPVGA